MLLDSSSRPARSRSARRLLTGGVVGLLLLTAACSDDGEPEGDGTTTTAAVSSTTTTAAPVDQGPLGVALIDPAEVAEGLTATDASEFGTGICEGQEIEETWEDQASQYLVRSGGAGTLIMRQSVLAFESPEAAEAFVNAVSAAVTACIPSLPIEEVPDVAERAIRFIPPAGSPPTASGAVIRRGVHVSYFEANGADTVDFTALVDNDLLTQLAALLPE